MWIIHRMSTRFLDDFVAVEDEALLEEVYTEFKKNYKGEYEFE